MAYLPCLVVFCVLSTVLRSGDSFGLPAGPYKVNVKQFETCADEGNGQIHVGNKISKIGNEKYVYNSPFNFDVPIDENMKVHLEAQQWGNGGYKPRTVQYTANNCKEVWKYQHLFFTRLYKSAGVNITRCPIPKGNYHAHNLSLEGLTFNSIPMIIYGNFKCIVTYFYKGVKVGCVIFYFGAVPK